MIKNIQIQLTQYIIFGRHKIRKQDCNNTLLVAGDCYQKFAWTLNLCFQSCRHVEYHILYSSQSAATGYHYMIHPSDQCFQEAWWLLHSLVQCGDELCNYIQHLQWRINIVSRAGIMALVRASVSSQRVQDFLFYVVTGTLIEVAMVLVFWKWCFYMWTSPQHKRPLRKRPWVSVRQSILSMVSVCYGSQYSL